MREKTKYFYFITQFLACVTSNPTKSRVYKALKRYLIIRDNDIKGTSIYALIICGKYQPLETKIVKCIEPDCGKEFEVDARNNTKTRCDECYEIYRNNKNKEKALRYYHKNKNTLPDDLES